MIASVRADDRDYQRFPVAVVENIFVPVCCDGFVFVFSQRFSKLDAAHLD